MYCILIAGMPAAGKTRFAEWLGAKLGLPFFSKDAFKEILFDEIGFCSREEKVALGQAAMKLLYAAAESEMKAGRAFLLENNFEDCSRAGILELLGRYDYHPVTVLFDGEVDVIYRRFLARDQSPGRHRGHVVNTAYPETGERPHDRPMGLDAFREGMERRGFRRFSVGGPVVRVDATDLDSIDYNAIAAAVGEWITAERGSASGRESDHI